MNEITRAAAAEIEGHGGLLAAHVLRSHGVDTLFTLSGGHLFPLYDGCVKTGIRLVDTRHEQTAVFAAEGWAKVTRRVGVAALTAGPGVTNGLSAITGAFFTGSPVVVVGGRAPAARWGQGSLQELDHVPIVESVTKLALTCRATERVPADVARVLEAATSARRGPTFLDIPLDVIFNSGRAPLPEPVSRPTPEPDPGALVRIGELLAKSARPVLMVGAGAYWEGAEDALARLAEGARVPVFMNGLGRGLLSADHELAFSRCRSLAFRGADLVIVAGTPLDFRLGFGQFGSGRVVHLMDSPGDLARHVALADAASGNLAGAFDGILAACLAAAATTRAGWIESLQAAEQQGRQKEAALFASEQDPILPVRIYGELRRRLERDAIVIGDGGDFVSYAGKYVDTYTPGCFLDPGPYGCLGTGLGYALGARLAHPGRQVVLLLGDGAAGFALADFDTLVRFSLPVVAIVGNNLCWGLEKHPMKQLYGYHVAAELAPSARYDRVVEALGGAGRLVSRPADVGPALDWALEQKGPVLLNVMTDPEDVYPRSSVLA